MVSLPTECGTGIDDGCISSIAHVRDEKTACHVHGAEDDPWVVTRRDFGEDGEHVETRSRVQGEGRWDERGYYWGRLRGIDEVLGE